MKSLATQCVARWTVSLFLAMDGRLDLVASIDDGLEDVDERRSRVSADALRQPGSPPCSLIFCGPPATSENVSETSRACGTIITLAY